MSGKIVNNVFRASGVIAATPGGLDWSTAVVTGSTLSASAGKGYFINTTSNACTLTLPASPSVGDQLIFSDFKFILLSLIIFSSLMFTLLFISEFIFFEPFFVTHIPPGSEFGFVLIAILSILSALVIPMNLFRITYLKNSKPKMGGSILGSVMGYIACACSCGHIGFAVLSTFV